MAERQTRTVHVEYRRMVNAGEEFSLILTGSAGGGKPFDARCILTSASGVLQESPWSSFSGRESGSYCVHVDTLPWAAEDHLSLSVEIRQDGKIIRYDGLSPIQVEVAGNYDDRMIRQAVSRIGKVLLKTGYDDDGNMTVSADADEPLAKVELLNNGNTVITFFEGKSRKVQFKIPMELRFMPGQSNLKFTFANGKVRYGKPFMQRRTRDLRRVKVWHAKGNRPAMVMCSGSRLRTAPFKRKVQAGTVIVPDSLISGYTAFTLEMNLLPRKIGGVQMIAERKGVFRLLSDNGRIILLVRSADGRQQLCGETDLKLIAGKKMKLLWNYNFNVQTLTLDGKKFDCNFVRMSDEMSQRFKAGNFEGTVFNLSVTFGN